MTTIDRSEVSTPQIVLSASVSEFSLTAANPFGHVVFSQDFVADMYIPTKDLRALAVALIEMADAIDTEKEAGR